MTLQQHKEKEAEKYYNSGANMTGVSLYSKKDFISGFDAADPIGFMEWYYNKKEWYPVSDGIYRNTDESGETITTEQLYLLFIEYKQKQQA